MNVVVVGDGRRVDRRLFLAALLAERFPVLPVSPSDPPEYVRAVAQGIAAGDTQETAVTRRRELLEAVGQRGRIHFPGDHRWPKPRTRKVYGGMAYRRISDRPKTEVDDVAVDRAVNGDRAQPLSYAERREAVRVLWERSYSDPLIAVVLDMSARQVFRIRRELGLPAVPFRDQVQARV